MNQLFKALRIKDELTENLMPTHSSSDNYLLDMFFKMGGSRDLDPQEIARMFNGAWGEDPLLTLKATFYNRDIRGGQGERKSFRIFFHILCNFHPEIALKNFENVIKFGRWDDILVALDSPLAEPCADFILFALKNGDGLCAKWMPRENKSLGEVAKILMRIWGISPNEYRKLLSGNTQVVENLMCKKEWGEINYGHVPSVASFKYRKAFLRNDRKRYGEYLAKVAKGEAKIHAEAIFPHTIIQPILKHLTKLSRFWDYKELSAEEISMLQSQWVSLPNWLNETENLNLITVNDVSGSMHGLPLEVCVALGIYISERNKGIFKDGFITFSGRPQLQYLKGDLISKVSQLMTAAWEGNTNLMAVFDLLLSSAVRENIPEEQMPRIILILSDMQFDYCVRNPNLSAMEMIKAQYTEHGYKLPQIIFWNLRTSSGIPVKFNESGTALVSGFSPSLMKSIVGGELTPMKMLLSILNQERYNSVTL